MPAWWAVRWLICGLLTTANAAGLLTTANAAGLLTTANAAGLLTTANAAGLLATAPASRRRSFAARLSGGGRDEPDKQL
jgi:hypothetical protein